MEENGYLKNIFYMLLIMVIIVCAFLLKTLSAIVLPIVFAVLLGFVVLPVVNNLNRRLYIPWALGSIIVTVLAMLVMFAVSSLVVTSLRSITNEIPKYEDRFESLYKVVSSKIDLGFDDNKSLFQNVWGISQIRSATQKLAVTLSSGIVGAGKSVLMVFLLMAFFLIESRTIRDKINVAFEGSAKTRVKKVSVKVVKEVVRYLSIKFYVSLATGLIVFAGAFLVGVDFPIVWGFFAFVLNFIPTFGSIISCVVTTLFTALQFYPSWWQIIVMFIILFSVNFVLGNILEPRIEGKNLDLSPFVILVSLSIWGYIWGFLGMLLAVPMMVIIKIICENVSYLKSVAVLLGNGPARMAAALNSSSSQNTAGEQKK